MTLPDLLRALLEAHTGNATIFETAWTTASAYGVAISLINLRDACVDCDALADPLVVGDLTRRGVNILNVRIAARGFIRAEKIKLYVKFGFAAVGILAMLAPAQHAGGSLFAEARTALFSLFAISLVVVMDWQSARDRADRRRMITNAARAHEEGEG